MVSALFRRVLPFAAIPRLTTSSVIAHDEVVPEICIRRVLNEDYKLTTRTVECERKSHLLKGVILRRILRELFGLRVLLLRLKSHIKHRVLPIIIR